MYSKWQFSYKNGECSSFLIRAETALFYRFIGVINFRTKDPECLRLKLNSGNIWHWKILFADFTNASHVLTPCCCLLKKQFRKSFKTISVLQPRKFLLEWNESFFVYCSCREKFILLLFISNFHISMRFQLCFRCTTGSPAWRFPAP